MRLPALFRVSSSERSEVFRLVGPVMLEQTLISTMGIVGIILASNLGADAVTPMGLVDALHMLFVLFFTSIAAGATVIVAQHYGRGEGTAANEAARQAMVTSVAISMALVAALAFTGVALVDLLYGIESDTIRRGVSDYLYPSLFSYPMLAVVATGCGVLRGAGDTRTPMAITAMMGTLNALLSALLIYGVDFSLLGLRIWLPAYGIMGAALAILLSRAFGAALISYVLVKGQRSIRFSLRGFRLHMGIQRSLFSLGIPMTAESVLFQVGKVITSIIIAACGNVQMNANIIASSIFSLVCVPGNAFAVAAMPLVGQSVGRGDYPAARDRMLYVNWLSSIGLFLTCAAMMLFAWPLVGLYTRDAAVAKIAVDMLKVVAVSMPFFWPVSFVLSSALKGAGDAKYSMVTSIIGMWAFRVLLGYILGITLHMGAVGVYIGMCTDWVVRGILYYIRVRGNRWHAHACNLAAVPGVER
jgi:putative MATE family efflux protein